MDTFLYVGFPYVALAAAIFGGIYRFYFRRFTYSSMSSQLLENRRLFWGSASWHYGISLILLAHLLAGLFPGLAQMILGSRLRLMILEFTGMALGLLALFGLVVLILRRTGRSSRARRVTSILDGVLLAFLLAQVASGVGVAIFDRWGSLWYLKTAVPWLWSLALFHPNVSAVAFLPPLVKFHFLCGFAVILLFPFSRLVHLIKFPVHYLWRPYQVVIWNRRPRGETGLPELLK